MNETVHAATSFIHTGLGSLALLGGLVALSAVKGSRLHIRGGKVFVWLMLFVVITSLIFMFETVLPLAIVLSLAEVYLIPSALLSFNRQARGFATWNALLMSLAGLLCLFVLIQFLRVYFVADQFVLGPLVMATMFGLLFIGDWRMLAGHHDHPNFWIRRHLVRMILAFTIAMMALVRIGVPFGLSLEATVILPLTVAALAILWTYRRYPVATMVPPSAAGTH